MKVLIIEDDDLKYSHISKNCKEILPSAKFKWEKSFQTGLNELLDSEYDLILLDMSMHIYEKSSEESGGSFETYAGRMILSEIDINEIETKVIVITGYDIYNDGKTLETLKQELREEFGSFYLGTVYFIGKDEGWKAELNELIKKNF
jgi:CheY-like chemotaxis protein